MIHRSLEEEPPAPKAGGLLKTSLLFPVSPLKQNNLVVIAPCGWPCADVPICLLGGHKSRHNRDRTRDLEISDLRSNQCRWAVCFYLRGRKASNCGMHSTPRQTVNQRESSLARCPVYRSPSRLAASASSANSRRNAKNAGGCPMKSPMAVRNLRAAIAAPAVLVGRIMEHTGRLRLKNIVGSGMIRFVWKSSPPRGEALRSGNTSVESLGSINGGALPALSCQV